LVDLYRLIGGGGLSGASVVALGFMPYLSARLWWWLAQRVSPRLAAWAAEPAHATASRRWIRGLTIGGAVVQSAGLASYLLEIPGVVTYPAAGFTLGFMATLTGGAVLAMLLSESVERTLMGDHDSPPAPSHTDRALAEPRALPLSRPHATPVSDAATDRAPAYSPDRR
jgi:preprotein translocase subunit SecY